MAVSIRAIRAHEWREARDLRLRALQDEAAAMAFLDTFAEASTRPESHWRERAAGAADDTGDATARQFVAVTHDGSWVGSVVARVGAHGIEVVAVYLDPAHRGRGVIQRLLDAAVAWAAERGATRVRLTVHAENARARAAYSKAGFRPTGVRLSSSIGPELEMVREIRESASRPGA